jgi:hypothetical protein
MPKVPVEQRPTETTGPIPRTYLHTNFDVGPNLLSQAAKVGASFAEAHYLKEQKEALTTASVEAQTDFQTGLDAILYKPPDANGKADTAGFKYQRGDAAIEKLPGTRKAISDLQAEISGRISNPDLQRAFLQTTSAQIIASDREMMTHVGAEIEGKKDAAFKAKWKATIRTMGTAFDNPERQMVEAVNMRGVLEEEAARRQMPKEVRDEMFASFKAESVEAILKGYLAVNDWQGAEGVLATVGSALDPDVRLSFEQHIRPLKSSTQGEMAARAIIAKADVNGKWNTEIAEGLLSSMPAGPIYDEARKRVEHAKGQFDARDADQIDTLWNEAYSILNRLGTLTPTDQTPGATDGDRLRLPQIKASLLRRKAGAWESLEQINDRMNRNLPDREMENPDEVALFAKLLNQAAEDPDGFKDVKLAQDYVNVLSNRHLEHLINISGEIRRVSAQGAAEFNLLLDSKIINYYAAQAKIIPIDVPGKVEKWTAGQSTKYQQLFDRVKAETDQIRATGKKPSHEEVETITRKALARVMLQTEGMFGRGERQAFAFEIQPGQHTHEIIPPGYRRAIIAGIESENKASPIAQRPVTEDLIQATWQVFKASHPEGELPPPPPEPEPTKSKEQDPWNLPAGRR